MPVPPAPFQRHAQDRAGSRPSGRAVRWALRVLLITGALLGGASPALAAVHPAGGFTTTARTAHAAHAAPAARPVVATLTANLTPALPGGSARCPASATSAG